jgi:crossover junction endodeoxyribonuclease RusA
MTVRLPFPPSKLSRNSSQGNYHGKAKAAASYRDDCLWSLKEQRPSIATDHTHLVITYCQPDRRARDLDNLLAMTKQGIDALAEYAGLNDVLFTYTLLRGDVVKGGAVCIHATLPPTTETLTKWGWTDG